MNHTWKVQNVNHGPALKCENCGHVWLPHHRKPLSLCVKPQDYIHHPRVSVLA